MKVIIHAHHLALPPDFSEFLEKHVTRPLSRFFDDTAASLEVYAGDARPQRGGVDQELLLTFRMPGAKQINVGSVKDDLYKAMLDATKRLQRLVKRELGKMRSGSRKQEHRPLGRSYRNRTSSEGVTPTGDPATL